MFTTKRVCLAFLFALLFGCTPKTLVIENQAQSDIMPFIRDGITEREEVLIRLGKPASTYKGSQIITYWLWKDELGKFVVIPKQRLPHDMRGTGFKENLHNLILVFDSVDVLERHSIVFIR